MYNKKTEDSKNVQPAAVFTTADEYSNNTDDDTKCCNTDHYSTSQV